MKSLLYAITELDVLISSYHKCLVDCDWKQSVQSFSMNYLSNLIKLQQKVRSGKYRPTLNPEFFINERGKPRAIRPTNFEDRILQRALCDHILLPAVKDKLIYDNGASLKGKGISFSRERMQKHLRSYIHQHGTKGYILQLDFSKFFDNMSHEKLLEMFEKEIDDPQVIDLLWMYFQTFAIDIGAMSKEEQEAVTHGVFNSLNYTRNKNREFPSVWLNKSMAIGSQISQVAGIYYVHQLDNYVKIVRGAKYYGRYMDDLYIIHHDKEYLQSVLDGMRKIIKELGMFVNEKKTCIKPLKQGFTFLQVRYNITPTGKILKRLTREKITRQRKRLKSYKRLYDRGIFTSADVKQNYKSWKGNLRGINCYKSIKEMDKLFFELFKVSI